MIHQSSQLPSYVPPLARRPFCFFRGCETFQPPVCFGSMQPKLISHFFQEMSEKKKMNNGIINFCHSHMSPTQPERGNVAGTPKAEETADVSLWVKGQTCISVHN